MHSPPYFRLGAIVLVLSLLTACDTAEERAQKHLNSSIELLEKGDVERALVELRNVFVLDATNIEARFLYADASREIGNYAEAFKSFQRVVEVDPTNARARLAMAELAIETQTWDEAERQIGMLVQSGATLDGVETAKLALEFRKAAVAQDNARFRELTREARALFQTRPDDFLLQRFLIEGMAREGDIDGALEITELAISQRPDDRSLYLVRAQLLNRTGDRAAVEQHLRETAERFPQDNETKGLLVNLLASQGRIGDAEDFLRDVLAKSESPQEAHVTLITFIRQTRGNEAALQELDTAIATYESNRLFRALHAGITYDAGDTAAGIEDMTEVLSGAEPGEETNRFKVTLARMLVETGEQERAQALVAEILGDDAGHVEALKMQARWEIDDDRPEDALRSLRLALDRVPDDSEALMLMSDAHQRIGNSELAQDMMAQAVDASDNAPREALVFARALFEEEQYRTAEDVLISALRRSPGNVELLVLLGQIHIATQDWGRAEQVEATLRRLNTEFAETQAEELQFQIFGRREGRDRAIAYLEDLVASDEGSQAAVIALIRARLADGRGDEALLLAKELVEDLPDSVQSKLILGNTYIALEDFEEAETVIRDTLAENDDPAVALQLVRVLSAQARVDDARDALEDALETSPEDKNLLWVKASFLESANDIDGAIAIYQDLYIQDSRSLVIANNLASLLATYREDEESLRRAYTVARRLRGTEVPPFQDTYGWIQFRRGEIEESIRYLEPAAEGLPGDPIVQYHLAKAYLAANRETEALEQFRKAVSVAAEDDNRPQIQEARAILSGENAPSGGQ